MWKYFFTFANEYTVAMWEVSSIALNYERLTGNRFRIFDVIRKKNNEYIIVSREMLFLRWLFNNRARRRLNGKSGTGPLSFSSSLALFVLIPSPSFVRYSLSPPLPFPLHTPIFQLIRVHSWYRVAQPYPSASRFIFPASPLSLFVPPPLLLSS